MMDQSFQIDHQYTTAATKRIREVIDQHQGTFQFASGTEGLLCAACGLELDSFEQDYVNAHLQSDSHSFAFINYLKGLKNKKGTNRREAECDNSSAVAQVNLATVGAALIDQTIVFNSDLTKLHCNLCDEEVNDVILALCEHLACKKHKQNIALKLYQNDDVPLMELVEKYADDFCYEPENQIKCKRCDRKMVANYNNLIRHMKTKKHKMENGASIFVGDEQYVADIHNI